MEKNVEIKKLVCKSLLEMIENGCTVEQFKEELIKKCQQYNLDLYLSRPIFVAGLTSIEYLEKLTDDVKELSLSYNLTEDAKITLIFSELGFENMRRGEVCRMFNIDDIGEFSDGYHTFNSLYEQRCVLFAALVKAYKDKTWKSRRHSDGEKCFDGNWFIVGIETPEGQYTYHYENKDWELFDCKEIERAHEWDGHTDKDVKRLLSL